MGKNVYKILVRKLQGKRSVGHLCKGKINIKINSTAPLYELNSTG